MRALFSRCRQEHLARRIGEYRGANIAPFDHVVAARADALLLRNERFTHRRRGRNRRDRLVDLGRADDRGHIRAIDEHATRNRVVALVLESDLAHTSQFPERRRIRKIDSLFKRFPRDRAVHRTRIQARKTKLTCYRFGNR